MAMTKRERAAKHQVERILGEQGYPTYASLLELFDFNLTQDPEVVAYMIPSKAVIVVNEGLDIEQVSTIVRHEILHEYLSHAKRIDKHLDGKPENHKQANIAGDYEISNVGYTDTDKRIARSIKLNGKTLQGLVTEDQHPDWVDLSFEEMYDKLSEEMQQEESDAADKLSADNADSATQQAEEAVRQAQASKEAAEDAAENNQQGEFTDGKPSDSGDSTSAGELTPEQAAELADKAKEAAQQAAKDAKNLEDKAKDNGEVFDTPQTQSAEDAIKARIQKIKDLLDSPQMQEAIKGESAAAIEREAQAKARKEAESYKTSAIQRFKASLVKFIRNELSINREGTWKKFNKTYAHSPIIRRGIASVESRNKPSINVYFDHSSSWDESKIKVGKGAIGVLNNYVRRGEISIYVYYFGTYVSTEPNETGAGTRGTPILEHIQATKPQNVIIMTDSDISDCTYSVTVPGAVWFLFKGGVSANIQEAVHGKNQTQSFYLDSI